MPRGISEAGRRYAEKSLRCFIEGGRYARNGKPQNIKWLIGVISSSGATPEELKDMLTKVGHLKTDEEKSRLHEAKTRIEEIIKIRLS